MNDEKTIIRILKALNYGFQKTTFSIELYDFANYIIEGLKLVYGYSNDEIDTMIEKAKG